MGKNRGLKWVCDGAHRSYRAETVRTTVDGPNRIERLQYTAICGECGSEFAFTLQEAINGIEEIPEGTPEPLAEWECDHPLTRMKILEEQSVQTGPGSWDVSYKCECQDCGDIVEWTDSL